MFSSAHQIFAPVLLSHPSPPFNRHFDIISEVIASGATSPHNIGQAFTVLDEGNPAAGMVKTASATYTRPYQAHAAIGPSCAVALFENDALTVWSHTQGVYPDRAAIAEMLRMPIERVRCIHAEDRAGTGIRSRAQSYNRSVGRYMSKSHLTDIGSPAFNWASYPILRFSSVPDAVDVLPS